jgi:DsbC/DsbD-like thiol-disulfide interchange protein
MLLAIASLLLASVPQDPRAGSDPDGNTLVKVELVSERSKLHPGEHFTLAAKLTVTPRWHIYWGESAGETGVPTRVEIEAPKGFTLGRPQFPVPERHVEPGPLVSYVHEGTLLVLFDAVAPDELEPGTKARFELSASWLVCTSRCFEGAGTAAIELECAQKGAPVPANEALFKQARAQQPRPLSELQGLGTGSSVDVKNPGEYRCEISVPGALELSFLPAEQRDPAFVSSSGAGEHLELVYRWKEPPKGARKLRSPGLLQVRTKNGTASYWFDREHDVAYPN